MQSEAGGQLGEVRAAVSWEAPPSWVCIWRRSLGAALEGLPTCWAQQKKLPFVRAGGDMHPTLSRTGLEQRRAFTSGCLGWVFCSTFKSEMNVFGQLVPA